MNQAEDRNNRGKYCHYKSSIEIVNMLQDLGKKLKKAHQKEVEMIIEKVEMFDNTVFSEITESNAYLVGAYGHVKNEANPYGGKNQKLKENQLSGSIRFMEQ
jgi:hypothetical protein